MLLSLFISILTLHQPQQSPASTDLAEQLIGRWSARQLLVDGEYFYGNRGIEVARLTVREDRTYRWLDRVDNSYHEGSWQLKPDGVLELVNETQTLLFWVPEISDTALELQFATEEREARYVWKRIKEKG